MLINLAIRHGDRHKPTMEIADHWLLEKDLVHKLFKVLVPRYHKSSSCYTKIYRLPNKYDLNTPTEDYLPFPAAKPKFYRDMSILELKGNPFPPVLPVQRDTRGILVNVLVNAAKNDFYKSKGTHKDYTQSAVQNPAQKTQDLATDEIQSEDQMTETDTTGTKT